MIQMFWVHFGRKSWYQWQVIWFATIINFHLICGIPYRLPQCVQLHWYITQTEEDLNLNHPKNSRAANYEDPMRSWFMDSHFATSNHKLIWAHHWLRNIKPNNPSSISIWKYFIITVPKVRVLLPSIELWHWPVIPFTFLVTKRVLTINLNQPWRKCINASKESI